jgi:eukaryotic-like serine/threonine-protein kinase
MPRRRIAACLVVSVLLNGCAAHRLLFQPPAALEPRDPRIPPALATVLSCALSKNASDRYPSARDMAAALQSAAAATDEGDTVVLASPFGGPTLPGASPSTPQPPMAPLAAANPETYVVAPTGTASATGTGYGAIPASDATVAQRELAFFLGPIASVLVRRTAQKVGTTHELWGALAAHIERAEDRTAFLRKRPR